MTNSELIIACLKNDKTAKRQFFEQFYGELKIISLRYCKDNAQSEDALLNGFKHIFMNLHALKSQNTINLEDFVRKEFINFVVKYIKDIRSEYYVASTVKAVEQKERSYDLFLDSKLIDFRNIDQKTVLKSIQSIVPSQRLIFNLHIIDGYTLEEVSELLDTSEQSIKANLEKARFNLQKEIEKNLKSTPDEQPV
jgi:RNA polymerase sigma-70 factor (ECF subfamily)